VADLDLGRRTLWTDRYWLAPGAVALFIGAVAGTCLAASIVGALASLLIWLTPLVFVLWSMTRRRDVAARVQGGSLVLEGSASIATRDIAAGYVSQEKDALAVVLELRNRTLLRLSVRDLDDARAVLTALGQDPSQRRTRFEHKRIFHQLLTVVLGPMVGVFALLPVLTALREAGLAPDGGQLVLVAMALGLVLVVALRRAIFPRLDLTVGRDGLWSRARLFPRFFPWSQVASAREDGTDVVLTLADRREVRLWCDTEDPWVRGAVCARIAEALADFRAARTAGDPLTTLARGDRPYAAWRDHLKELGDRPNDYRSQALDRRRLEALVTDPSASPEQRIAAALALSTSERGRTRVRVAAESGAEPAERAALAAIAEGRDAEPEVEAALRRG